MDDLILEQFIVLIRQRMRSLWTKKKIVDDLCKFIPHDVLFICYKAAEIMESDYGRPRD
jgi:hypothetical protein